jgi:MFS family permease
MENNSNALKLLLVVQMTNVIRSGLVSPILALYIRNQGLSVTQIGLIGTAGMLGWLIFEPIIGVVADRIQKKYLVMFSVTFSSFVYLAYPYAAGFWYFASLAFAMASIMSAYAVAIKALTAELIPPSGRGKTYGRFVSSISFGGIIAPFVGGYLSEVFNRTIPFYISAGIGSIGLIAMLLMKYDDGAQATTSKESDVFESLWSRSYITILLTRALYMFNLVFRQNTLPIFLNEHPSINASESEIGFYMTIVQLTSAISKAYLGELNDRIGSKRIITYSLLLSGISYTGLIFITSTFALFALGAFQGIFFAAADLSMMIYLMTIMPKSRSGIVMGLYSEAENIGGMLAAPSLGLFYDTYGPVFSVWSVILALIINSGLSLALLQRAQLSNKRV